MSRSRTCRRAAEVRWTVESHPTLIYCRSRQYVLGSLVANIGGGYDLAAPDAAVLPSETSKVSPSSSTVLLATSAAVCVARPV